MNNIDRAKQFLPFDAMKGLTEALREREERRTRVERKQLDDSEIEAISRALARSERGSIVRATFYLDGHYITIDGRVRERSSEGQYIVIGEGKIFFEDIISFEVL